MKKIYKFAIASIVLVMIFSSCTKKEEISNVHPKTEDPIPARFTYDLDKRIAKFSDSDTRVIGFTSRHSVKYHLKSTPPAFGYVLCSNDTGTIVEGYENFLIVKPERYAGGYLLYFKFDRDEDYARFNIDPFFLEYDRKSFLVIDKASGRSIEIQTDEFFEQTFALILHD